MVTVRIPTVLRKHTDGAAKVEAEGATVKEVFGDLVGRFPELEDQLLDGDGGAKGWINVYVEDEDIRYVEGIDTPVDAGDEISLMPAVAGGMR